MKATHTGLEVPAAVGTTPLHSKVMVHQREAGVVTRAGSQKGGLKTGLGWRQVILSVPRE
jgi:hypothetical protein